MRTNPHTIENIIITLSHLYNLPYGDVLEDVCTWIDQVIPYTDLWDTDEMNLTQLGAYAITDIADIEYDAAALIATLT